MGSPRGYNVFLLWYLLIEKTSGQTEGGGVDHVLKVLRHFLPKYLVNIWILGLSKSYLMVVQNGPVQKLPNGCPKGRGGRGAGVKATFGQCPNKRRFLFGCVPLGFSCRVWKYHPNMAVFHPYVNQELTFNGFWIFSLEPWLLGSWVPSQMLIVCYIEPSRLWRNLEFGYLH